VRSIVKCLPLELGQNMSQELRIHFRVLGLQLRGLYSQGETLGHSFDVARQHVVREEPHFDANTEILAWNSIAYKARELIRSPAREQPA
jgi:hypothetical protein